jgi:hypothetical protein
MLKDQLGHPLEVGLTVLAAGYYQPNLNTITTVEKVTKTAIYVQLDCRQWERKEAGDGYLLIAKTKSMRRRPDQVIVVQQQLKHNRKHYPELMI